MPSNDLTTNLIQAMLKDLEVFGADNWQSISVVIDPSYSRDDRFVVQRITSSLYGNKGYLGRSLVGGKSTELLNAGLGSALRAYLNSLYPSDKEWPVRLLIQYNRETNQHNIEIEASNPNRWKMDHFNMDQYRKDIMPRFTV